MHILIILYDKNTHKLDYFTTNYVKIGKLRYFFKFTI